MLGGLPRRKRQLVWTSVLAIAFVAAALGVVRLLVSPADTYRPGEEVEGLTAALSRDLPDDSPDVHFVDAAADAGIEARHFPGVRSSQLPEDMGSGAAWGDYDNDGWQDLFLVNIAGPLGGADTGSAEDASGEEDAPAAGRSTLYRNLGNGRFEDVTDASGIRHAAIGMGAAWADYDGDGWRDLVITAYGSNALYRNAGDGTFVDVTRAAGLSRDIGFWSGAAWGDYDRDGDPDLYVTGYARYTPGANAGVRLLQYDVEVPASLNPSSYRPERNLLYRNDGDGTFTEVAAAAGVDDLEGRSLNAAWADFDGDGWLDLYVANDVSDNALYRNRGDGTFEDVSHAALVADYRGAMGLAVGDWDGDGDPDLFITHWIAQENALFTNRRAGDAPGDPPRPLQFLDEADRYGLGQIALDYVGWGTSFLDYDNDGQPDLFVANGSTFQRDDDPTRLVPMQDQLFWNRGKEGFFDVSAVAGPWFAERHVGRGAAFADYDRDGDVDIVVVNHGERPALLRNEGGNRGAWLSVSLDGDPVGARVRVVADGRSRVEWLGVQSSYLSGNSPVLHFGLGEAAVVDTVEVAWADGTIDVWAGVEPRREIRLSEGGAAPETVAGAAPQTASGGASQPASGGASQAATRPDAPSPDDRERTRRFWETYREATRLRTTGDLEAAARRLEEAHALDPAHEDALYYLGGVRADLGDPAGALEALDELVRLNPRSGRALMRRGALLACPAPGAPTDLARARGSFEAAWAINREQVGPALWLGVVELLAGDLTAAAERLDDVLGSHRDNLAARVLRGYIAQAGGDVAAARADLRSVAGGAGEGAEGASGEVGLREGDTGSERALFTGACPWLEQTLRAAVEAASPEAAYEALRARFEAAGARY